MKTKNCLILKQNFKVDNSLNDLSICSINHTPNICGKCDNWFWIDSFFEIIRLFVVCTHTKKMPNYYSSRIIYDKNHVWQTSAKVFKQNHFSTNQFVCIDYNSIVHTLYDFKYQNDMRNKTESKQNFNDSKFKILFLLFFFKCDCINVNSWWLNHCLLSSNV